MNTTKKNVAIVSGGSKGLGEAIVQHLLNKNYQVATFSRHPTDFINKLMQESNKENFYWEAIDASDLGAVNQFVHSVIHKFGEVGALVNNVGMSSEGIITMMNKKTISNVLNLNLEGAIHLTQYCVKNMLIHKYGNIINISSVVGLRGFAGQSIYSASKAGLDGFTRSLSRELAPRGIRVNGIAPGYLKTDMTSQMTEKQLQHIIRRTPLGRLGRVEDIIGVVEFLLSPAADFITGQIIVADGGLTC